MKIVFNNGIIVDRPITFNGNTVTIYDDTPISAGFKTYNQGVLITDASEYTNVLAECDGFYVLGNAAGVADWERELERQEERRRHKEERAKLAAERYAAWQAEQERLAAIALEEEQARFAEEQARLEAEAGVDPEEGLEEPQEELEPEEEPSEPIEENEEETEESSEDEEGLDESEETANAAEIGGDE